MDIGVGIVVVAIAGKAGGAFLAARSAGLAPREAATLGLLMNTRGLTELIVLSIGLQTGLLTARLYSVLVVMAIVTTGMAGPLLRLTEDPGGRLAAGDRSPHPTRTV